MMAAKTSEITHQIEKGEGVSLSFHYHNKNTLRFLNSLFTKVLSRDDKIYLHNTLMTILRELIVNAVKANTKRVYFVKNNLSIHDPEQYMLGMEAFKSYLIDNQEGSEEDLRRSDYRVTLKIKKEDQGIQIAVENNAGIMPDELNKINHRLKQAKTYNDFGEVYEDISDENEGEGLGIMLTMLFLRNSGIGDQSFEITSTSNRTRTSFVIPRQLKPIELTTRIQEQILSDVDELPSFPEHIQRLIAMCKEPDASIKAITQNIIVDPSLSASVLRLANSAGFITMKRIENIDEAIMIIGLKNLNAILMASSARKILDERYSHFRKIWEHCNKTAFYSRIITSNFRMAKIQEHAILAGLLHDLGKIVLLSTNSSLAQWISDLAVNRKIRTSTVLEEVSIGISHSAIGELIAAKWNFPDYITESISHHHAPLSCRGASREIVYIIYLANKLCGIEDRRYDYPSVEEDVLAFFNITKESELVALHEQCKRKFEDNIGHVA